MPAIDQYTMLIAGLPYHASLFAAKQTPLSRLKLEARLRVLEEDHAQQLKLVTDMIRWGPLQALKDDAAAVNIARRDVDRVESPTLRRIVRDRLEMRTMVIALRKRTRGDPAPSTRQRWGYGRWLDTISRNWSDPGFRLERAFPWILDANKLFRDQDVLGMERLIMGTAWDQLGRATEGHVFDFEAVTIYVLRWDLIARWTSYDAEKAAQRFASLMESGLGDAVTLFD